MAAKKSRRAKQTKSANKKFLKQKLNQINKVFAKFEKEVEKTVEKFMKQSEKSSSSLRQNFDDILDRISNTGVYSKATEKTEDLVGDIRDLADDVVGKVKDFNFGKANDLLEDIRSQVDDAIEKIQSIGFVDKAKEQATQAKKQVLNVLRIPSSEDLDHLTKKVNMLERKVRTLTKKAA